MIKKFKILSITIILISLVALGAFALSKLSPSSSPAATFYSLNDIYNLIVNNTPKSNPNSSISTTTLPTATTSHSTSEIYALLANLVKQENLDNGFQVLGVTGNYGNPDPNYATITASSSSLSPIAPVDSLTGYTLEDIYNLIKNNATTTSGSHTFPITAAPSPTMVTTSDIYTELTNLISNLNTNKTKFVGTILGVNGTYNPATAVRSGLVGYWPLNETSGTVAYDYSGNGNNGLLNGGVAVNQSGKVGKAFNFDGNNGYLNIYDSSSLHLGKTLSFSTWVNVTGDVHAELGLLSKHMQDNNNPEDYDFYLDGGNHLTFCNWGWDTPDINMYINGVKLTNLTYDGTCYVSEDTLSPGIFSNIALTFTFNGDVDLGNNGFGLIIGGLEWLSDNSGPQLLFNGSIDDVALWHRVLSEGEITKLYNNGSGMSLILNDGSLGSSCTNNSQCDSNNCYSNVCSAQLPSLTSGLAGYWPLDVDTNDYSGNGNNGVNNPDAPAVPATGKVNGAYSFGSDTYSGSIINTGYSGDIKTISVWFKPDVDIAPEAQGVFSQSPSDETYGFQCRNEWFGFGCWPSDIVFGDYSELSIINPFVGGNWYNLVIVRKASSIDYYVNGAYQSTQNAIWTTSGELVIGQNGNRDMAWFGLIDEVAVWDRYLSSQEISNIYNGGAGMSIITP